MQRTETKLRISLLSKCAILVAALLPLLAAEGWAERWKVTEESFDNAPAPSSAPSTQDWSKLNAEALDYFREYLRFDTSNPPGDTSSAILWLKSIFDKEGIHTEVYGFNKKKLNLIARIPGPEEERPFLMMSHADVVPAVASKWSHPPFAADLSDDYVWGRGAIDNKAHGIMALMTMLAIKRQNVPLRRGIEMMVNADEEVGGGQGAEWMAANHWESIDPAFAVNEGGGGISNWLGTSGVTFRIALAEKRVMWLRLVAHGKSGHGSEPNADNPNLILIAALSRLFAADQPMRLTPIFDEAMKTIAPRLSFPDSTELAHLEMPLMMNAAARGPLSDYMVQALMRDTISPTMLTAGFKANVIPSTAEAVLDCRLLPGTDADAFLSRMRDLMAEPRLSVEFIQRPDDTPPSPMEGEAWGAIEDIVQRDFKDALVVPWMTAGGTDSRFLRSRNVPAYGFVPIVLDRQEASRVHGVDERLSVENLNRGVRATYELAMELCGPRP